MILRGDASFVAGSGCRGFIGRGRRGYNRGPRLRVLRGQNHEFTSCDVIKVFAITVISAHAGIQWAGEAHVARPLDLRFRGDDETAERRAFIEQILSTVPSSGLHP